MSVQPEPLTERILGGLPGPRAFRIAAWAAVPWLNAGANLLLEDEARSAVWEQSDVVVVLNYALLSLAVVIALVGAERIARRLHSLLTTSSVLAGDPHTSFRELNSTTGPLVASAAAGLAFGLTALVQDGPAAALLRGATWFVLGIALFTYLWTYGSLLLGLDRLGRRQLRDEAALIDPGLGLQPFGRLAFTGLWMLLVWLVPLLLTGLPDVVGVVIGLLVLTAALTTFFLSLYRLHRQMVAVKARELELARSLYAKAYEPVRSEATVEALDRQHHLLHAADGLERRRARSTTGRSTKELLPASSRSPRALPRSRSRASSSIRLGSDDRAATVSSHATRLVDRQRGSNDQQEQGECSMEQG